MTNINVLKRRSYKFLLVSALVLGCMLFIPAGTLNYWEAWLFLVVLFTPVVLVFSYLLRHDPELLERRLQMHEREEPLKLKGLVLLSLVILMSLFMIPGLDHRFGWSEVPAGIVLLADGAVLAGYYLFFKTLQENSYASRTIEVTQGQEVITTGPYSIVRHPMYTSVIIMYIAATLALGSWWAPILMAFYLPFYLRYRILAEEKVLLRDLPGYNAYLQKVKWRLIPHLW